MLPVAEARSSSDDITICYLLPVLWMICCSSTLLQLQLSLTPIILLTVELIMILIEYFEMKGLRKILRVSWTAKKMSGFLTKLA